MPGRRVCKYHGGLGGAPKGSKNALKTGEYETIWSDQLTDEERTLYERIKTDKLAQIDQEIKLTEIRERRMLQRIAHLTGLEFTVVEKSQEKGVGSDGPVDKTMIKEAATLGQIQRIEEALTRVQERKQKLLELKHRIEEGTEGDTGSLAALAEVIRESRRRLAEIEGGGAS